MKTKTFEQAEKSGIRSVTTSATGTDWVQLTSVPCHQVAIYNDTGTSLEVRYGNLDGSAILGEATLKIPDGVTQPLRGLSDARQIHVKRADNGSTQVTCSFIYEL